ILAVVHEPAWHRDSAAEHRLERKNAARRIVFEHLAHHAGVEGFVPGLVAGNYPTDPGKVQVAVPGSHPADVTVRDACRALLERGVDEQVVGIGPGLRVEAIDD